MKQYRCIATCTWGGRMWREGATTPLFPVSIILPEHFEEIKIDKEEKEETSVIVDDLNNKTRDELIIIAKVKGVYKTTMRTKDSLIEAIEGQE